MAMLAVMLKRDQEGWGMSVGEAGWPFGITRREYVALEEGTAKPSSDTYERICELYGWPDAPRVPETVPTGEPWRRERSFQILSQRRTE
jgi:hypothetical protein